MVGGLNPSKKMGPVCDQHSSPKKQKGKTMNKTYSQINQEKHPSIGKEDILSRPQSLRGTTQYHRYSPQQIPDCVRMEPKPIFRYERFIEWVKANNMFEQGRYNVIYAVERWDLEYGDRYELPEKLVQSYYHEMMLENFPPRCLRDD